MAISCLDIETALGLVRGDIQELRLLADNTVEVKTQKVLTITQQNTLAGLFPTSAEIVVTDV